MNVDFFYTKLLLSALKGTCRAGRLDLAKKDLVVCDVGGFDTVGCGDDDPLGDEGAAASQPDLTSCVLGVQLGLPGELALGCVPPTNDSLSN